MIFLVSPLLLDYKTRSHEIIGKQNIPLNNSKVTLVEAVEQSLK